MKYTFKFSLFGKKVQMFSEGERGIVVEKEPQVVCVYGTDSNYNILCAIPLCHPKFLKGAEYIVEFDENNCAKICVGDLQIVINYSEKRSVLIANLSNAMVQTVGDRMSKATGMRFDQFKYNI